MLIQNPEKRRSCQTPAGRPRPHQTGTMTSQREILSTSPKEIRLTSPKPTRSITTMTSQLRATRCNFHRTESERTRLRFVCLFYCFFNLILIN